MRKLVLILVALAMTTGLGACSGPSDLNSGGSTDKGPAKTLDYARDLPRADSGAGYQPRVWTDPETGCQYLLFRGYVETGVVARLNRDGLPICQK